MAIYEGIPLPNTGLRALLNDFINPPLDEDGGDAWNYWSHVTELSFAILDDGRVLHLGVGEFGAYVDGVNRTGSLVMDDLVFNPASGAVERVNPRHFHDEAAGQSGYWLEDSLGSCYGCVALPGDYVIAFYEASSWVGSNADWWGILIHWPAGGQSQVVDTYEGFLGGVGGNDWTSVSRADRSNGVVLATDVDDAGDKFKFWNFSHAGGTLSVDVSTVGVTSTQEGHFQATCAVVDGTERMFLAYYNYSTSEQEVMALPWSGNTVLSGPVASGEFISLFPEAVNDGGSYDPDLMTWSGLDRSNTGMVYLGDGVVAWMSVVDYTTPNVYEGATRWEYDYYGLIGCRATFSDGSWSPMHVERINDNVNKFLWGPPIVYANPIRDYAIGVITRSGDSDIIDYVIAFRITKEEFLWDVIPMGPMLDAVDRWWGTFASIYPAAFQGSKFLMGHSLYVPEGTKAEPGDTVGAPSTAFITLVGIDYQLGTGQRSRRFEFE